MAVKLVRRRIGDDGFVDPQRPKEEIPEIVINVDLLTDDELMHQYNLFNAWTAYLSVEAAKAEKTEDELEDDITVLKAEFVLAGDKLTRDRAEADTSAKMKQARLDYRVAKNVRKLLEAKAANCERNALAMSRELTRRTEISKIDRGRRWGP